MKISLNWILEYIPGLKIENYGDLINSMISAGLDIESVEFESEKFKNFIVGEVLETSKHPNAEKLTICKVNTGEKVLNIVCGAPNVAVGQKVCLALTGAIVPKGNFEIKKSKIRGELSEGMICAEDELGISDNHSGIMVLDVTAIVGMNFADYIKTNDVLFEIGVTPNRGDLFSQIGMAREIAAIYEQKVIKPVINIEESDLKTEDFVSIHIENREYCKRFTGRVVNNVQIKESPEWLKKRLISVGLRPVNNIVDITNFVMMETGQPLHAFDYDKIKGKKIIVKVAKEGDKFTTLDSKVRILNDKSLMVCDGEGYSGIAGIMGGELSEITEKTRNVFIESAYFDPVCIRKNSKKLGLQTDASQRFERGVDIENVEYASNRAAQLIQEIAEGEVCRGLLDVYPDKFDKLLVGVRKERLSKIIGVQYSEEEIINLLGKIEIKYIEKKEDKIIFEIPEYRRNDITRESDLIEEIARLSGYENLKNEYNFLVNPLSEFDNSEDFLKFKNQIREHFVGRGFNEIISYSQQDAKILNHFTQSFVGIENPNSTEMNVMRENLTYGILDIAKININNAGKDVSLKLFEIGKVFRNDGNKYDERTNLCFALYGRNDLDYYSNKDDRFGMMDIKGEMEMLMFKLNLEIYRYIYYNKESNVLEFKVNNEVFGMISEVETRILQLFDIKNDVYICELDLDVLYKERKNGNIYSQVSKFPTVKRDLALIVNNYVHYSDISELLKKFGGKTLKEISLFDIYSDEKIGTNKKSIAVSLEFQSEEKTMTDDEVNNQVEKLIKNLKKELNIELRS
jgi:phenylalanyl-tRNA synthetase beta chain